MGKEENRQLRNAMMALGYLVAKSGGLVSIPAVEFAEFMKGKGYAEITYITDPPTMVLRTTIPKVT